MKRKTLIILSAVFALMVAASAGLILSSRQKPLPRLCAGKAKQIAALEFSYPGGKTAKFIKTDKGWEIASPISYKADERELASAVSALCGLRLSETLSASPETARMFGLNPENGVGIALSGADNKKIAEFTAGKEGLSAEAFFIKLPSGEIKEASGLARAALARPFTEWLDKTVFSAPMNKITSVAWHKGKDNWRVYAENGKWLLESAGKKTAIPAEKYQGKIGPLLMSLADLRAERVLPSSGEYAPKTAFKEDFSLDIKADTPAAAIRIGAADSSGGRAALLKGENRVTFIVPDWRAADLLLNPSGIK
ncbi:MAG: DUF4340 domain-containing protein [Elusimicrobiales bacterium]